jgi:mannose-6-phosphate isomerase-like protein (cupin superfamily)
MDITTIASTTTTAGPAAPGTAPASAGMAAPAAPTAAPTFASAEQLLVGTRGTRRFEGREFGAGISYFFVDALPGDGAGLHWHPYPETWLVLEGSARTTIGGEEHVLHGGDTATVPANTWHGFVNAGSGRLKLIGIHASDTIIQTFAE